ncbi:hypothetical protein D3C79_983600 [compost metagenome]
MITGPTVQTTSTAVLWLVLDGFGFALARNLITHQISKARTSNVIGMINQSV